MQRFRINYSKSKELRYTGNLDMQKVWERFLRRADVPVAYSQGFHPQARIQQACPLPLGFFSEVEIVDIWLEDDLIDPDEVKRALDAAGQPGIVINRVSLIPQSDPALQSVVASAHYRIELLEPQNPELLQAQVNRIQNASELNRQRRSKTYNLRSLIEALTLHSIGDPQKIVIEMRLAAREGATGRPDEVLDELGLNPARARITRTGLFF